MNPNLFHVTWYIPKLGNRIKILNFYTVSIVRIVSFIPYPLPISGFQNKSAFWKKLAYQLPHKMFHANPTSENLTLRDLNNGNADRPMLQNV